VSTAQLVISHVYFVPLWVFGVRKVPTFHSQKLFWTSVAPQGFFHMLVHLGAVVSMGLGAVSFTHVVKASEPVVTALLSWMAFGQVMSIWTYMALLPIIGGVTMASLTDLSFNWASFTCAMVSNLGSSGRAIVAKKVMNNPKEVGDDLTASNMYAVLTSVAAVMAVVVAVVMEGEIWAETWKNCPHSNYDLAYYIVSSSIFFYSYNEVAFLTLEKVNQVTHAVGNALKRVVIIAAAVVFLKDPLTLQGAAGSAVAVGGALAYSLAKHKFG